MLSNRYDTARELPGFASEPGPVVCLRCVTVAVVLWQVVAVQLRPGHQHTAVCVGSLPCSSDEERTSTGKQAARKEFIIVASYCEHEGDDGHSGGALCDGSH